MPTLVKGVPSAWHWARGRAARWAEPHGGRGPWRGGEAAAVVASTLGAGQHIGSNATHCTALACTS